MARPFPTLLLVLLWSGSAVAQTSTPFHHQFSTYTGGSDADNAAAVTVDADGVAWIAGTACSQDLPTSADALQPVSAGICDGFVQAFGPDGASRYLTYLGGAGQDRISAIARGADGSLYVAGWSQSRNLPVTAGAFSTVGDGRDGDGFVIKLSSDARRVVWGTYLGGSAADGILGLAVDRSGTVHVAGYTLSGDFPLTSPALAQRSDLDAFYARLSADGDTLGYATILGGETQDAATSVAVDPSGNAYVAGRTDSLDFPSTPSPARNVYGGASGDGWIAKFAPSGLQYVKPFGGTLSDAIYAIAVNGSAVFVSGATCSANYTPSPADARACGSPAAFVARVRPSDGAVERVTILDGPTQADSAEAMAVDDHDRVYVSGRTFSSDFPVTGDAAQPAWSSPGYGAAFFALVPMGLSDPATPQYATYLGGENHFQYGAGVAIAPGGAAYVVGATEAPNFPTVNAWQTTFAVEDGFVARYDVTGTQPRPGDATNPIAITSGSTVVSGFGRGEFRSVSFSLSGGDSFTISGHINDGLGQSGPLPPCTQLGPCTAGMTTNTSTTDVMSNAFGSATLDGTYYSQVLYRYNSTFTFTGEDVVLPATTADAFDVQSPFVFQGVASIWFIDASDTQTFYGDVSLTGRGTATMHLDRYGSGYAISRFTYDFDNAATPLPPAPGDFDGDGRGDRAVFRPASATWLIEPSTTEQFGATGDIPVPGDYDGDGTLDIAVFRPATGEWLVRSQPTVQIGRSGDVPVPADYNGDRRTEPAVYRTSDGTLAYWYVSGESSPRQFGMRGDIPMPADYDGDGLADLAVFRPSNGTWYALTSSTSTATATQFGAAGDIPVAADFDGDGKADIVVFRPATGVWYLQQTQDGFTAVPFGQSGDVPLVIDLDGGRIAELTVWRPSTGVWYSLNRVTGAVDTGVWGKPGDVPAIARPAIHAMASRDFDGDGRADVMVYRPSNGMWYIRQSSTENGVTVQWGIAGDVAVPGDYDGDRRADVAVYRPSQGEWFVIDSGSGAMRSRQWGSAGDIPVPGDYDGDGRTDFAVYRPSTFEWWVLQSAGNYSTYAVIQLGRDGDIPVPADYDGDGRTDVAVYGPSTGDWGLRLSSAGSGSPVVRQWGLAGDVPVPADFDGDGRIDLAVYRPSDGNWYVLDPIANQAAAVVQWGLQDDTPAPQDFDGDGAADRVVYRPSTGEWFVSLASGGVAQFQWGVSGDTPLQRASD